MWRVQQRHLTPTLMLPERLMQAFDWATLPEMRTQRLLLRALTAADSADVFAIYGDPEVMEFAGDPPFDDPGLVAQMLGSVDHLFRERQALEWGIVHAQEGRVIGTCGIHSFAADGTAAELGCLLARRAWGQGLMAEALVSLIDLGFATLGLAALRADIDAPNLRSRRLFQRLGFQPDPARAPLLMLTRDAWSVVRR
jgi:RimJ/RimL family protein N-acetyltransferase